jgi:hypothetical protein
LGALLSFHPTSWKSPAANFLHGQILLDQQKDPTKEEGSGIRPEIMKGRISFQPPEEKTVVFCGRFV